MIHNFTPNASISMEVVVRQIAELNETFFLTGSRFTFTANEKSDVDFFVMDSGLVRGKLRTLGFETIQTNGRVDVRVHDDFDTNEWKTQPYTDSSIEAVFRKICSDGHVDVQLVKPEFLIKKIEVNESLHKMCKVSKFASFWQKLDKYSRRSIWQQMLLSEQ
jgi:hypothetical protein